MEKSHPPFSVRRYLPTCRKLVSMSSTVTNQSKVTQKLGESKIKALYLAYRSEKMERLSYSSRCALVVDLVQRLRRRGSWCGETHLQKALYILQDLTNSNFGYKFVIYKHGPYSFELNNELSAMRASNILEFQFPKDGYGPSIAVTPFGERVHEINSENIKNFSAVEDFLANWFAASDV